MLALGLLAVPWVARAAEKIQEQCVSESEVEQENPGMPRVLRAVGAEAEAVVSAFEAGVPRDAYDTVIILRMGIIPGMGSAAFVAVLFKDGCGRGRKFIGETEYERAVKAQESQRQRR